LAKVNQLNLKFQKNLCEINSINSAIKEFYNSIANVLLKEEHKNTGLNKKNDLVMKLKDLNLMTMDEKLSKSPEELAVYFENYYNHVIPLSQICNTDQKLDLISYLQQFLMRLLYKAEKRLPFDDELLHSIPSLHPDSFDTLAILGLAKRFRNIIPDEDYHKLFEELERAEGSLKTLQTLYNSFKKENWNCSIKF